MHLADRTLNAIKKTTSIITLPKFIDYPCTTNSQQNLPLFTQHFQATTNNQFDFSSFPIL